MRALLVTTAVILSLATQAPCAEELYAVGKYIPGPLITYSVSSSGEIAELDVADELSWDYEAHIDRGGRVAFALGDGALLTYRITPDRHLALASSVEAEASTGWWNHTGMTQDGRLVFVSLADRRSGELQSGFQTFLINNRLRIRSTGFTLDTAGLGGIFDWAISDQNQYTAIVNLGAPESQFVILHLSSSGEITDSGQRVATPDSHNVPLDLSPDGRWLLTGRQSSTVLDAALYEVLPSGEVAFRSSGHWPDLGFVASVRLWPEPTGILIAGDPGLFSVSRSPESQLGDILDHEVPAYGLCQGLAVSPDGKMVLVDDQAPGFTFPLYSYLLSEDGQLTPTGYHLSRPDHHADLRFIPAPTPVILAGDANCDGVVDVADAVFLINEALPDDKPILLPQNFANADLDNDVDVDDADFEALVEMLLGLIVESR